MEPNNDEEANNNGKPEDTILNSSKIMPCKEKNTVSFRTYNIEEVEDNELNSSKMMFYKGNDMVSFRTYNTYIKKIDMSSDIITADTIYDHFSELKTASDILVSMICIYLNNRNK